MPRGRFPPGFHGYPFPPPDLPQIDRNVALSHFPFPPTMTGPVGDLPPGHPFGGRMVDPHRVPYPSPFWHIAPQLRAQRPTAHFESPGMTPPTLPPRYPLAMQHSPMGPPGRIAQENPLYRPEVHPPPFLGMRGMHELDEAEMIAWEELGSRMPIPDFVPDFVEDENERRYWKQMIAENVKREARIARPVGNKWGTSVANFGASGVANVQFPATATLIDWRSPSDEPEEFVITMYAVEDTSAPSFQVGPGTDNSIFAKIEWGSAGATFLAFVDMTPGAQIRLSGSRFGVQALALPGQPTFAPALPAGWPPVPVQSTAAIGMTPMTVTGMIGRGSPGFKTSARFTRKFNLAAAGGADTLSADPIPRWANGFTILTSGAAAVALTIKLLRAGSNFTGTVPQYTVTTNQFDNDAFFPIPNGYEFITVQNTAATPVNVILCYSLML